MTKRLITLGFGTAFTLVLTTEAGYPVTFDVPAQPLGDVAEGAVAAAAFYLGNLTVLAMLTIIAVSLRQWVWALYTQLVLLGLIYIGLFEQNITGIVWSGIDVDPRDLIAGGYAMLSINYLVAAHAIPAGHKWAWLKTPYRAAAVGIWAIWALGRSGPMELGYLLFSITGCTVAIAHFFPVSTFSKLRGGYDRIIRNLIWALLTCVLIGGTVVIAGAFDGQNLTVTINRIVIAAITIGFGALFIRNIFVLKSDRELAVQEALDRALEQARISEELLAAQESHKAAVELARSRTLRLATASHDIRQPLSSLRTAFTALSRDMPEDTRRHLQNSLDYLDELASSYLTEADADRDGKDLDRQSLEEQERVDDDADQQVKAEQVGETLRRMFDGDAMEKGLGLEMDVAPATLQTGPLALMRVLCNVLSNAIVHGSPGPLRVSGSLSEDGYTFEIRNSGAAALDFQAWNKGENSDGSGLGLAIVRQQADRTGLILSTPDCGPDITCISVTIPDRAEDDLS